MSVALCVAPSDSICTNCVRTSCRTPCARAENGADLVNCALVRPLIPAPGREPGALSVPDRPERVRENSGVYLLPTVTVMFFPCST
eukprot:1968348-Rhodomonas_salina.5